MTTTHFVDFEISTEKGDFLKPTIGHLGLKGGNKLYPRSAKKTHTVSVPRNYHAGPNHVIMEGQ